MRMQRHAAGVDVRAPAKVNLFLEVLARRADGYHDIATLMCAVSLCDTLECRAAPNGEVTLTCDLPGLETGAGNLVCRAAGALQRHTGCTQGARIHLQKRIPLAAGLAGGSSDAAAALAGLNELWQLGLPDAELAKMGAEIGSDVAFFFSTPAAWCTGRGERVTPAPLGRTLDLLLLCPDEGLSTPAVYRGVTVPEEPVNGTPLREALAAGDVVRAGALLHNRLQPPAERLCPAVAEWQARLTALQPAGAAMSGSGSSLFALCRDRREALRIARALHASARGRNTAGGPKLVLVRSCV